MVLEGTERHTKQLLGQERGRISTERGKVCVAHKCEGFKFEVAHAAGSMELRNCFPQGSLKEKREGTRVPSPSPQPFNSLTSSPSYSTCQQ